MLLSLYSIPSTIVPPLSGILLVLSPVEVAQNGLFQGIAEVFEEVECLRVLAITL